MIRDCWNIVGVDGDGSCPELATHAHCHHCPVYAAAAEELLSRTSADDTIAEWTRHFAQPRPIVERDTQSAVVFRVAAEWFALSTPIVIEVTTATRLHSLSHRESRVVEGVINVRGELLVCISLASALGVEPAAAPQAVNPVPEPRMLVIRHGDVRAACPVDQVHGVVRFHPRILRDVPTTLSRASVSFSKKLLPWQNRSVGLLDEDQLFHALKRSFA